MEQLMHSKNTYGTPPQCHGITSRLGITRVRRNKTNTLCVKSLIYGIRGRHILGEHMRY